MEQKDYQSRQRYLKSGQEGFQTIAGITGSGAKHCIVISAVIRFYRTDDSICYVLQKFSKLFLIIVQNFTIPSEIVENKSDGLFYTFCLFNSWSPDQRECTKISHS